MLLGARDKVLWTSVGMVRHLGLAHLLTDFRHEGAVELAAELALLEASPKFSLALASLRSMSSRMSKSVARVPKRLECLAQYLQQYISDWFLVETGCASVLLWPPSLAAGMWLFITW